MKRNKRKDAPVEDDDGDYNDECTSEDTPSRMTLGEMAAQTAAKVAEFAAAGGGVKCPKCGCAHSRVVNTWDVASVRRRRRVCRHCGRQWGTTES